MPDDEYTPMSRWRLASYLVVGALAVIGAFSIVGFVMSTIFWLVRAVLLVVVAVAVIWVLKLVFIGRSSRDERTELDDPRRAA
jgi:hypothetical protein